MSDQLVLEAQLTLAKHIPRGFDFLYKLTQDIVVAPPQLSCPSRGGYTAACLPCSASLSVPCPSRLLWSSLVPGHLSQEAPALFLGLQQQNSLRFLLHHSRRLQSNNSKNVKILSATSLLISEKSFEPGDTCFIFRPLPQALPRLVNTTAKPREDKGKGLSHY